MGNRFTTLILVFIFSNVLFAGSQEKLFDFSQDKIGGDPKAFVSVVGHWLVEKDGDKNVLAVDGRKWEEGKASAGLADKARALYGAKYAEFLDSVQTYAYFPLIVSKEIENFTEGELNLRFKPLEGRIDQGAGIAFNLKPNGDYLVVRANALEDNLVLFKYVHGSRSSVKWIRNTPTASKKWHDLKLVILGKKLTAYLDGKEYLSFELEQLVSGKIAIWSKADSYVQFESFRVQSK